jgi:hypothetical protein
MGMTERGQMKTVTVNVTADHIARGKEDHRCAPVAIAIREALGITTDILLWQESPLFVYGGSIALKTPAGPWHSYGLPDEARHLIRSFDAGNPVVPFAFELDLEVPDED